MAYNTKNIIRDAAGAPIPQYYNPTTDAYEPLQGAANANRVLLYDANGNPLLTAANPGVVKISDGTDTLAIDADGSLLAKLTGSLPAGTNEIGKVQTSGSFITEEEVISTNTVVAAGTNYFSATKTDNGNRIGGGVALSSIAKFKLYVVWRSIDDGYELGYTTLSDRSVTAGLFGSGETNKHTKRYKYCVKNVDTVDITIQKLIRTVFGV